MTYIYENEDEICGECQCNSCCFRMHDISNIYYHEYGILNCPHCNRCDHCAGKLITRCDEYKYSEYY